MEEGVDDLDSWMYQTVGHQVVAALGQCMGLPLYRRCIQGTSKDQASLACSGSTTSIGGIAGSPWPHLLHGGPHRSRSAVHWHSSLPCSPLPHHTIHSLQGLVYQHDACESDEVEDLSCLLAYCKDRIPGLEAVCSGAIASDYQRTRVENVCARLGLVSLAPLWHQPQSTLLRRMVRARRPVALWGTSLGPRRMRGG